MFLKMSNSKWRTKNCKFKKNGKNKQIYIF